MKIETKFNIGQEVYYINPNHPNDIYCGRIYEIKYDGKFIWYQVGFYDDWYTENSIYKTKKEAEENNK